MVKPWMVALGGGLTASAVILFVVVREKKNLYEARGRAMEVAMASGSGASALAQQAQAIQRRLQTFGEQYTEQLARRAADAHMANAYGLSRERIQGLERLARTIGV